ncbi:hypothetical protein DESC_370036 [Desulfosarcina cetonica]|nr:hypothetical protein DESC_370036 [Desulfosarcina cetonica]
MLFWMFQRKPMSMIKVSKNEKVLPFTKKKMAFSKDNLVFIKLTDSPDHSQNQKCLSGKLLRNGEGAHRYHGNHPDRNAGRTGTRATTGHE